MKKTLRYALAMGLPLLVIAGCSASASLDLSGIFTGTSGSSCTNTTPASGADAGGCNSGFLCFNTYCVQEGAMRISLSFTVNSDFDLHVKTPSGEEIFWDHRTAGAGNLDVDQCVLLCNGPTHVENVFFTADAAPGEYQFFVQNYSARAAGDFTIEVAANGQTQTFHGSLPDTSKANSETFTYTYAPASVLDAGTDAGDGG